jgi:hypothetical protein
VIDIGSGTLITIPRNPEAIIRRPAQMNTLPFVVGYPSLDLFEPEARHESSHLTKNLRPVGEEAMVSGSRHFHDPSIRTPP